jgi:thioredoxin 1
VMIPTQIFFNAQGKEVKRHIGFMDKADIVKELKALGVK